MDPEPPKEGFFAKIGIWLRADGRHAMFGIIAVSIAATAIWGGKDSGLAIVGLTWVAGMLAMTRR